MYIAYQVIGFYFDLRTLTRGGENTTTNLLYFSKTTYKIGVWLTAVADYILRQT